MAIAPRNLEFSIVVEATPDEVWLALTDGQAIERWFAPHARVCPGLGGTIFLSWGAGMEGEAPITAWQPGRRFSWTEGAGTDAPRVIDFKIEAADGGTTLLRLTHTGFVGDSSRDRQFDSTSGGWQSYLALLRHDLEEWRGRAARHLCHLQMINGERAAVWRRLLNTIGYQEDGERYSACLPDGTRFTGRLLWSRTPGYLVLATEGMLRGALALFVEDCGSQVAVTKSWYLKGGATKPDKSIESATNFVLSD